MNAATLHPLNGKRPARPAGERKLPHQVEAEVSVLGGILIKNEVLERLDTLEPDHFYDLKHQIVFHAIAAVSFGGSTVTHCRGRWPEGDTTERAISPPRDLQCGGCVGRLLEIESVERGLAEFVQEAGR